MGHLKKKQERTTDSSIVSKATKAAVNSSVIETAQFKDRILGAWTDGSDVNASFLIEKDSIFYTDGPARKYTLIGDSVKIQLEDLTYSANVYFKKDTMIMDSPELGELKYWRFKD